MARASTAVAKKQSTAVVTASMADDVAALAARLQAPSGDKVKVDNKQFTLPNGDTSDVLTGIIVDFVYYNAYYEGSYDPNNIQPPNCFALHPDPNGAVPSANSPDVQDSACGTCWANQFGSSGKGKACKNAVLLAMLPPEPEEDSPLMLVSVSPTALKSFSAYAASVARALQRPPYGVLTDITCDPNFKYDTLRFSNPQPLDADTIAIVRGRREEARQRLMTEPDVSNFGKEAAAPAGKPKGKLQAPKRRAA